MIGSHGIAPGVQDIAGPRPQIVPEAELVDGEVVDFVAGGELGGEVDAERERGPGDRGEAEDLGDGRDAVVEEE